MVVALDENSSEFVGWRNEVATLASRSSMGSTR